MSMEEGVQMQRRETEQKRTNEIRKRYLREKKKRSVHNRPGISLQLTSDPGPFKHIPLHEEPPAQRHSPATITRSSWWPKR